MLWKPGKETLLYKKTKKREINTSRIVNKTTAEGSNLQTIWHIRFEAKVQNYAQKNSFQSKLKLLVHLRAY
jgi:transcriptional regulator NrdR family protein